MPDAQTEQALREILWHSLDEDRYDLVHLKANLGPDSHLVTDVGIDSLDLLDFLLRIKGHFGVDVGRERRADLLTLRRLAEFVEGCTPSSIPPRANSSDEEVQ